MITVRQGVEAAIGAACVWYVLGLKGPKLTSRQMRLFGDYEWLLHRPELLAALDRILVVAHDEFGDSVLETWCKIAEATNFCTYSETLVSMGNLVPPTLARDCGTSVHNCTFLVGKLWDKISLAGKRRMEEAVNMLHNAVLHSEKCTHRIAPVRLPGVA